MDGLYSDTSFVLMETNIKLGQDVAKEVNGKDLVILLGGTGAGKSVMFNHLINIPMDEYFPSEKGIQHSILDAVIDTVDGHSDAAALIGHTNEPMTLIPQISLLRDELLCCDCPGFLDNRENVEIRVANAVNIRNILYASRGVKIILLLEYSSLSTGRQNNVEMIGKIARNLFGSEDGLVQHADSILLGITKIPRAVKKQPFDTLKGVIQHSAGTVISHLSNNLFIFDPLDRDDLKYDRVWNREQLIENIKNLSSIDNPRQVFRTSLSSDDYLAVQNVCKELDEKIQKLIGKDELMKAAKHFQKLKSLKVLEHEVVDKAMNETRQNIQIIVSKIIKKVDENTDEGNLDKSKELLIDLRALMETFEDKSSEEELKRLESKYQNKKWWRDFKKHVAVGAAVTGAVVLGGAAVAGVVAVCVINPAAIPLVGAVALAAAKR